MPYEIVYTAKYERRLKRFLKKHSELFNQYAKTIELLKNNPHHPSLRLHQLREELQAYHSVSINIKYRITIEFIVQDQLIIPINIGSHDKAYQ
jgi:mRNA-degrading endonuclease YafQ of YafQ-DinJ toxin-antitoxin module